MTPEERAALNARPVNTRPGCYEIPSSALPGALRPFTKPVKPMPKPAVTLILGPTELLALAEERGLDATFQEAES